MPCVPFTTPEGGRGIACYATKRCKCARRATLLCDWKVPTKKTGTCDKGLCDRCTYKPASGKDLCPDHAAEWKARPFAGQHASG